MVGLTAMATSFSSLNPNRAGGLLGGTPVLNAWHADCVCHLSLAVINLRITDMKEKGLDWGFIFISKVLP